MDVSGDLRGMTTHSAPPAAGPPAAGTETASPAASPAAEPPHITPPRSRADTPPLTVALLGPQVITKNGKALPAPAPQQRRVLALLASRPGEVVSREWISRGLWGSATLTQLRGLQVYVSNLRSALGKTAIDLVGNGYRLNIDPQAIDEVVFKDSLALGHMQISQGLFDDAIGLFTAGLKLWRGDPYDDLPHREFIARRAGLLEAKLAAEDALLRARVELLRNVGAAEALVPRSAEIYAEQPRREGRMMLHLRCLMVAGRMADAATVANDYRNRLRADVGVEPGPAFTEFYSRLTRRDPALLPQAWGSSLAIPSYSTPLLGRDLELDLAVNLLRGNATRLLSVVGVSQVGKTRLAAAIAESFGSGLPGGVVWVGPESAGDAEAMLSAVAASVGINGTLGELRQRLPKALGSRRTLVVIDGATPGRLTPGLAILLASGPKVSILLTGTKAAGLASEQIITLHPLSATAGDGPSPAARFVTGFAQALGVPLPVAPSVIEEKVAASTGLPADLEQVVIDLLSGPATP